MAEFSPQHFKTLKEFKKGLFWNDAEAFSNNFPHPFMVIRVGGNISPDTGSHLTRGLKADLVRASVYQELEDVRFVVPVKKAGEMAIGAISMISLGRSGDNDIIVREKTLSKRHCMFQETEQGTFVIADGGSTNGTFLDGERLPLHESFGLVDGHEIKFGQSIIGTFYYPKTFFKFLKEE